MTSEIPPDARGGEKTATLKRWQKIIAWTISGLLIVIFGVVAWAWTTDLGVFKPRIEDWVTGYTGRAFSIEGDLDIDLDHTTVVSAGQIRLQNADWGREPNLLSVERFEIRLNLWSLLRGPVIVELVRIEGAAIHLARRQTGAANWHLGPPERADATAADSDRDSQGILLQQLDIDDVRIVYESPDRAGPIDIDIRRLDQQFREDEFLDIALEASVGERQLAFEAEIGTWGALLGGRDVRFDLVAELDSFSIQGNGMIDNLADPSRPSIEFSAHGNDVNELLIALGLRDRGQGDINLSGTLVAEGSAPLSLSVTGNLGQTDVQAAGSFSDLQHLEQADLNLLVSGPDLGRILRLVGANRIQESAPFMISLDARRDGPEVTVREARMVYADAQFELTAMLPSFPHVDDSSVNLSVTGPNFQRLRELLHLPGAATGEFRLNASIETPPDGIELAAVDLETSLGKLSARGRLREAPTYAGSEIEFGIEIFSLADASGAWGLPALPDSPARIEGAARLDRDGIRTIEPLVTRVGELTASLSGFLATEDGFVGSDIEAEIDGPELSALVHAFSPGAPVPSTPFDLRTNFGIRQGVYEIADLGGSIGSSTVVLDASILPDNRLAGSTVVFDVRGPALEELLAEVEQFSLNPGPYTFSGNVAFTEDTVRLSDIELDRELGGLSANLELALPVSRRSAEFDIRANGPDIRALLRGLERFEAYEAPFAIQTAGELRESRLTLETLDASIGDATLGAAGELDFAETARTTQFSFDLTIPDLAELGRFDGFPVTSQALSIESDIRGSARAVSAENLLLRIGESDARGTIRFEKSSPPRLSVNIESDALAVRPFLQKDEDAYEPEPEFDDGRLIPDIPLPLDAMGSLNAEVKIAIGELQRDTLRMRDLRLDALLEDGLFELREFGFAGMSGRLEARARVAPLPESSEGEFSLELAARDFTPGLQTDQDAWMTGDINLNLQSAGADIRTLAGNTDGIVFINTRGGRVGKNRMLQAIYGDMLNEIVGVINPFYEAEPYTKFDCIVIPLQIQDGALTGAPSGFIRTDKLRVTIAPEINLKTEALRLGFRTVPRRGLIISAGELLNPFVRVVGTLASPRIAVDEQGMLVSGGAAVATGGLSILAKAAWDRLNKSSDPCGDIARQATDALESQFPTFQGLDSVGQ